MKWRTADQKPSAHKSKDLGLTSTWLNIHQANTSALYITFSSYTVSTDFFLMPFIDKPLG